MYKFQQILCPTDFSENSLEAIRVAAFAAREFNGNITLLHVDEDDLSPYWHFNHDESKRAEHRKMLEQFAQERFTDIVGNLDLTAGRTLTKIQRGAAYKTIVHEAESGNYDAIALTTNGLGSTSPHLLGRTTERVVRLSRIPVLTVRPSQSSAVKTLKVILCPTDFSEYGNYALPYAISIALKFSAKLILLHITELSVEHSERLLNSFPDLQVYHEQARELSVTRLVDKDIEPENAIARVATEYLADLIVMGTHGARGMRRVQIGNTTEEIIRRVTMPVLSITHPVHKVIFPKRFSEEYKVSSKTGLIS